MDDIQAHGQPQPQAPAFIARARSAPEAPHPGFWTRVTRQFAPAAGLQADPPAEHPHFHAGDVVHVRSAVEILASLDMDGRLEGVAFQPEMIALIGTQQTVQRRADQVFALRRSISHAVFLASPDAGERLAWKEAWLTSADTAAEPLPRAEHAARQVLLTLAARTRSAESRRA